MKSLLLSLLAALSLSATAADQPNIVFLISDDQAWTDYGFMGHPQIETPNLDKLAARSALFSRGYVPTALCRPALATFTTGHYAHQSKITGNDPAAQFQRQKIIWHTVRVPASEYTMNLGALAGYQFPVGPVQLINGGRPIRELFA
jgi:hypothetical protein